MIYNNVDLQKAKRFAQQYGIREITKIYYKNLLCE